MEIRLLIWTFAALLTTVECYCSSTTLYPSTSSQSKSISSSYYAYCTISINRLWYYSSSSYYLEISWSSSNFDVKGNMPDCKENYVEVFLTSSYRSIGKFCSSNAAEPFKMYASDGYAKIVYRTGGYATGTGFKFYYKLKSRSSDHLGSSSSSTYCYNTNNYASSGVIYSNGWPKGYQSSYSSCDHEITKLSWYRGVYVVFMDINMYPYGYRPDCVQLYGSNTSSYYTTTISSKLCNTVYMKKYISYDSYLKISFDRTNGPSYSSYRGFVAGYIMFSASSLIDNRDTDSSKSSSPAVAISLGVVIPVLVIIIVVVAAIVYNKKRQPHNTTPVSTNQTQEPGTTSTNQQTTHQPAAVSNPQYAYPATTIRNGNYMTGSYAMSYPSAVSYPAVQYSSVGNATQQVSFVVAPSHSTVPAGALPQSSAPGQQSSGVTVYSSGTTASHIGNQPSSVPPVDASSNIPPPAYYTTVITS